LQFEYDLPGVYDYDEFKGSKYTKEQLGYLVMDEIKNFHEALAKK